MKPAQKYYLLAYNGIAFLAWLLYAWSILENILHYNGIRDISIIGHSFFLLLAIAQGLAVLEIVHAAIGIVRSPVGSTAAQVASRILVVILIFTVLWDDGGMAPASFGILFISVAWTITELVRYSFYFLGLLGREPRWLLWMRYTFFIVLYPLGVTGEWLIILYPVIIHGLTGLSTQNFYNTGITYHLNQTYYAIFTAILAISYIYYFPVLYRYMWRQRRKKLNEA